MSDVHEQDAALKLLAFGPLSIAAVMLPGPIELPSNPCRLRSMKSPADSGSLLLSFDQIGVYVSAGSACSAGDDKVSHVLQAIGVDSERYGTIRFSFGRETTKEDIDYLFEHLPKVLANLRSEDDEHRRSA